MKSLSNTVLAAIFAIALALIIAGSLKLSFFYDKESQTRDELMRLSYQLHNRISPIKPDPHLIFVPIDEKSLKGLGAWPFAREVHGQFLQVLAPEKPKVVGWDIFFTEAKRKAPSAADAPQTPDANSTAPTASDAAPTSTNAPPSSPDPASASPPVANATPAASDPATPPAPSPAKPSSSDPSAQEPLPVESDDQLFLDGVSLIPKMVTAAARNGDPRPSLKAADILPTRPITHVTGDITKLLYSKFAIVPFPALRKQSYFGFADEDIEGAGGVRRTLPLLVNIDGILLPSFDLQVLLLYWGIDPDQVTVNLGHEIILPHPDGTQSHIPIDQRGQAIINYRARASDFTARSYADMGAGLADKANNQQSSDRDHLPPIKDNIVIIGVTFAGTDASPTPLDLIAPLVSTHLNLLNNILQHDFVYPVSGWIWMPLYALFLFGTGILMLRVGIAPMIPIGLIAMLVLAGTAFAALWFGNLQIPVAMPEVGLLLLAGAVPTKRFFGEEREKRRVKAVLQANLSEKVMIKMLEHPDNIKLGGTKQVITVMFCDIRGFTKYCDNRDSAEVMEVLNEYMEAMTQVVFKYDGTVDKYIGDCIMAFWNAPQEQSDHAQRAVCCAMEMRYALANFKTLRAGKDVELFECGIGIHTGEALVGMMGSSIKRGYTAMGSTVNLGARLEALTKRLNERILISEDTAKELTGEFPLTDRGEAVVPGFTNPIHVYAVGADQDISSALKVGRTIAHQQEYTAEEATEPIWKPAPLPADADPNP